MQDLFFERRPKEMATVAPIRASEIKKIRETSIPSDIFEVFNQHITENFTGFSAVVYQDAIVKALEVRGLSRSDIYKYHWLDIEDSYRKAGWIVTYDKPGYNESYEAFFVFKKK